jgi:hypothetical protein
MSASGVTDSGYELQVQEAGGESRFTPGSTGQQRCPFLNSVFQDKKIIHQNDPKVGGMSTIVQPEWQNLNPPLNSCEPE